MRYEIIAILLSLLLHVGKCIWPRPYKVDLSEKKTFELSEEISSDDEDDIFDPDDEMIKPQDLARLNIHEDEDKHYRIHQVAIRRNKKSGDETTKTLNNNYRFNETNVYDYVESEPFQAEYVDNENDTQIIESKLNKFDQAIKRMTKNNTNEDDDYVDVNYDYSKYKAEYESDEQQVVKSNNTYNYTDVKEEESVGDALKTITDLKEPKNCTKEEIKGIGLNAAKCLLQDLKTEKATPQKRKNLFKHIVKYLLIWLALYVVIAVPCWCQNGWCCCCCMCKFCYPQQRIDDVKKFLADNPAGVYNKNGIRYEYRASIFENYAQKKLEKYIMKL